MVDGVAKVAHIFGKTLQNIFQHFLNVICIILYLNSKVNRMGPIQRRYDREHTHNQVWESSFIKDIYFWRKPKNFTQQQKNIRQNIFFFSFFLVCCFVVVVLLHKRKKEKRRGPPLEANHSSSHRWGIYIYIYIFLFLYIFPIFCWATGRPVAYRRGYTSTHTASTAHSTYNIVHLSHSFLFFLLFGWPQTTFLHSLAAGQQEGGNITRTGPAKPTSRRIGLTARRKHIFLFFFFFLYIPLTLSAVCCVYYISYSIYRYIYIYSLLCLLYYSQQPGMPGRKKKEKLFFYTCRRDFDCPAPKKSQKIKVDPFILFCVLTK